MEHVFEGAVSSFGLTIGLWVEYGGHCQSGAHGVEKALPKLAGELCIMVRDDRGGEAVESENMVKEDLCSVWGSGCGLQWDKMDHLGEGIDKDNNGIET